MLTLEDNFLKRSSLRSFIEMSMIFVGVLTVSALKLLSERRICILCLAVQRVKFEWRTDMRTMELPVI